jgi:putative ABC transport system permease protein
MISLVFRTLLHFRSLLIPVAIGVAVASAVIVGALVVGDSMRGSLRYIAMDRIGSIESVVIAPRWFNESLVQNLVQEDTPASSLHGLILVQQAIAERESFRASEMSLLGVDSDFWSLGSIAPNMVLGDEEIVLNQALADKLQAEVGDSITLRVASQSVVPADSPLGKREQDTMVLPRWKVVSILPNRSIARFSLRSDQRPILNAFANKESLQRGLDIAAKINAVFIAQSDSPGSPGQSQTPLLERLQPQLEDLGLHWQRVSRTFPDKTLGEKVKLDSDEARVVFDYHHLTTDQMLLTSKLADPILKSTLDYKPSTVLTYLANGAQALEDGKPVRRNVPYSTISAVNWSVISSMLRASELKPSDLPDSPNSENWVVITRWLADETGAKVGDTLRIEYFLPETVEGEELEKAADLKVIAIAPLVEPKTPYNRDRAAKFDKSPTPFNDPAWTPHVPGITDQESISDWDAPFRLTRKVLEQDDDYWYSHRLSPKLFISQDLGVQLFGSRFGNSSSIRWDGLSESAASDVGSKITSIARQEMTSLGWREIALRKQQLMAASGTTPFDALFLSLSFFVIVAGLLLVALLFRLAIDQRADHWGLLMASGWTRASVRRLLLLEGCIVSALGASLGVALGLGYAYAMIAGLRSWWIGAITVSFLEYHATPFSLVLGWLLGWLAAIATIMIATSQLKRIPIARLLKKQMDTGVSIQKKPKRRRSWVAISCIVLAVGILILGQFLQGQAQAGAFVGAGMLFMVAGLLGALARLKQVEPGLATSTNFGSSLINASSLASSNAKRAPIRSILAIGLVAVASFLILSMSLFQSVPSERGTGGFDFVAKSSHAIHKDLANQDYQREVLGVKRDGLDGIELVPFRVRGGDDASCNNLFQANEPQVLGVSPRMDKLDRSQSGRSAFAWFAAGGHDASSTPWSLLETEASGTAESPVPVILDQNTALWALHLGGYVGEQFSYDFADQKIHFKTVGVLQNTILQGSLIVGEANFEKCFPSITGHRMFLVKAKSKTSQSTDRKTVLDSAQRLTEEGWSEFGLSMVSSDEVLRQLLAVQNTYLGAFQVLGALGLLLGTIGLGIAQLRSAMERRGELAAMRAIGFTKARLIWLLTLENGWQLLRGIGIGVGSAALATLPAIMSGQPFAGIAWPLAMLGLVVACGLVCSIAAAYGAMRWPLLQALRADK